ncbi:hypothetical protein DEMA109039_07625 [Deinococcus marmoris]
MSLPDALPTRFFCKLRHGIHNVAAAVRGSRSRPPGCARDDAWNYR